MLTEIYVIKSLRITKRDGFTQIFYILVTYHVTTKTAHYHKHNVHFVYIIENIQHQMQMQSTGKYLDPHMIFHYENVSTHNARPISSGPNLHKGFVVCCISVDVPVGDWS